MDQDFIDDVWEQERDQPVGISDRPIVGQPPSADRAVIRPAPNSLDAQIQIQQNEIQQNEIGRNEIQQLIPLPPRVVPGHPWSTLPPGEYELTDDSGAEHELTDDSGAEYEHSGR